MKKICALSLCSCGLIISFAGAIWQTECIKYQNCIQNSLLSGTISTWKSGKNFDGNHLILVNPNDINDYVEFDFRELKRNVGLNSIDSIFFDGNGFYVLATESNERRIMKLFYVSSVGFNQIAENLVCRNWAYSGFIKSAGALFLKLDQNLYQIDTATKSIQKIKDFGTNKVHAYPYKSGILYQENNAIRFYSPVESKKLFDIPAGMRFDGWYNTEKSILISNRNRETYIMDLSTGEQKLFSKFLFINYGSYRNGVLLELMPKGGGGATPFDTDYTWSYLLGNDILTAFTVSVYNTDTKKIKNFYFSDNDVASYWLDIPYDKHRLEEIRKKIHL